MNLKIHLSLALIFEIQTLNLRIQERYKQHETYLKDEGFLV